MLGTVEEELKKSRRDSAFQGIGIYSALKNIGKWRTDFYSLGLSESHVEKLYGVFIEIDSMKQGRVPFSLLWDWFVVEYPMFCFLIENLNFVAFSLPLIDHFIIYVRLNIPRTPFTSRMAKTFDQDKDGRVDFREFTITAFLLCTKNKVS